MTSALSKSSHGLRLIKRWRANRFYEVQVDGRCLGTGGETGIRTLDTLSSIHAFQACAFSHSAISPWEDWLGSAGSQRLFIVTYKSRLLRAAAFLRGKNVASRALANVFSACEGLSPRLGPCGTVAGANAPAEQHPAASRLAYRWASRPPRRKPRIRGATAAT